MNNTEREMWVINDEGLTEQYEAWRRRNPGKGGMRGYLKIHREYLDSVIDNVLTGKKRAHYLKYG